jgi:phosphoribosylglycinamide formyltransferase-1
MARRRVAVLVSGSGSNLQALLDAAQSPEWPAEIALVLSNRPDAYGLARARDAGVPATVVDHKSHARREAFEDALQRHLDKARIEIVCLAGFMRVLTTPFVERWHNRMLNIHPSLLPSYRGLHTHERALADGVLVTGCTVHVVRPELDAGPIVVQGIAPVLPGDAPERLSARVLEIEHRVYPRALGLFASGRARVLDDKVMIEDEQPGERLILHPLLSIGLAER